MSKITAIHGGGDWHDASVDYLVISEGINLKEEYRQYQKWYKEVYCSNGNSQLPRKSQRISYMTFGEWLRKNCNARDVNEDELEIFEDI